MTIPARFARLASLPLPGSLASRFHAWLRGAPAGLIALAIVTGAGAGSGAVAFRYLILAVTWLFTGRADYSSAGHAASPHLPGLGIYFVVLVPVVGGLVYGPLVDRFAREARGHGVPEVMLAVAERGGRIPPQVAVVKSVASALCIGSGGSVGREGPIVQIGSALGSTLGQALRVSESRLRLLVACGAAGGISATFNAPIAGVFFALELILRDFETESFGAVVLASVAAAVIGRAAFGDHPFLTLPAFQVTSPVEFLGYALLGVLAAVAGVLFTTVLYRTEDLADRLWRGPEWLRPATGGVLLGLLLLALPQMYGVGYPVLQSGVTGHIAAGFLLVLLVSKVVATSLTIAIGGSGGVFAPSLFMGAMLGTAFGDLAHGVFPHLTAAAGAYGLVGMGAVFAGAARAPITAVLIIFELTGEYSIVLPLMTAVVLATAVSSRLSRDTIYTLKLRRRGIDILRGRAANLMEVITVADAMQPVPPLVGADEPLETVIDRLAEERREALPVVGADGSYRGTVTSRETEASARDNALDVTAADLASELPAVLPGMSLHQALGLLSGHEATGVPVLGEDGRHLTGWLYPRDIPQAYAKRLRLDAPSAVSDGLKGLRVLALELTDSQPPVGRQVAQVSWPPGCRLVALRRGGHLVPVSGDTVLARGDRLTLLLPEAQAEQVSESVRGTT